MTPSTFLFLHSDIRSDGRKNFEQNRTILQKGLGAAIKKVYNYIRLEFYTQNEDKVRQLISCVLEEYKLGKIDYIEAKKRSYEKIYQSVDASFDYDIEFAKDTCYRNIPSVDNSLFTIARKLILAERTPV